MKSKKGYREQKELYVTGRWLKRYFLKRTCRKNKPVEQEFIEGLILNQKPTPPEFKKTVDEYFFDLG